MDAIAALASIFASFIFVRGLHFIFFPKNSRKLNKDILNRPKLHYRIIAVPAILLSLVVFFFILQKVAFIDIFVILFGLLFFTVGWALLVAPEACKTMWLAYLSKSDRFVFWMGVFHIFAAAVIIAATILN